MMVEHAFICVREPAEALESMGDALAAHGFRRKELGEDRGEWLRPAARAGAPEVRVILEGARGKFTLAASVRYGGKDKPAFSRLLLELARHVEQAAAGPRDTAADRFNPLYAELDKARASFQLQPSGEFRPWRLLKIVLWALGGFVALCVVIAIIGMIGAAVTGK